MQDTAQLLIVDDQEGIRSFLAQACAMLGYSAITAASGSEALQSINNHSFQACLIDYNMPGLNGLSTIEHITELQPNLSTFLMTGSDDQQLQRSALEKGAKGILYKPFNLDQLKSILENL